MHHGLVAGPVRVSVEEHVEAGHAGFPVGPRARRLVGALVGQVEGGEYLEGVVVELGNALTTVAPDGPSAVRIGARDQSAEVARTKPCELALRLVEHLLAVGDGAGEVRAVLLVTSPVGDRVLAVGQERVSPADTHHGPSVAESPPETSDSIW